MKQSGTIPTSLGTESIPKLLKQYAVPAIIAMTASSLYNMVDSAYIGQGVGPMAISGLAVTFPLMNLSTAFGTLVGVGASTLISVLLGQRNYSVARRVLGNVIIMNCVIGLLFMAVSLLFLDPILYFFGASVKVIKSGDHIHLSSVASAPQCLIKAMCERGRAAIGFLSLFSVRVHRNHNF